MIRVLLVDDSPLVITILKRMLSRSKEIEVVGTALNGRDALKIIPEVKPDVVCTDLHMPVMNGLELTKEIMDRYPMPILIVSVSGREGSINAFKVIEAGAIDIMLKPNGGADVDQDLLSVEFITKIRILSAVHVYRRKKSEVLPGTDINNKTETFLANPAIRIVVIGSSTGGSQALQQILACLPENFPLPVICIQHISTGFLPGLIDWLSSKTKMKIETARAGALPQPGIVYFPQEGAHLKIDGSGRFVISLDPEYDGHLPSITVTMKSAAAYYKNSIAGVILTGMGKDGAEGLLAIKNSGGITIVQDEESCIIFGMPKKAIELGAAAYISPLSEIGPMILDYALNKLKRNTPA
jgi:two-component system chemotaxis response regulator CheB